MTDRRRGRRASGAAVEPTRAAGDLISRHYNDGQIIIIGHYLSTALDVLIPPSRYVLSCDDIVPFSILPL